MPHSWRCVSSQTARASPKWPRASPTVRLAAWFSLCFISNTSLGTRQEKRYNTNWPLPSTTASSLRTAPIQLHAGLLTPTPSRGESHRATDIEGFSLIQPYEPSSRPAVYGKWRYMSAATRRMDLESDVLATDNQIRLVDLPENANDVQLWLCILHFRYKRDGIHGAEAVLQGLLRRRTLYETKGEAAEIFWRTLLSVPFPNRKYMEDVWAYALWLFNEHHIRWPDLYWGILCFYLDRGWTKQCLQWHLRISATLGTDATSLARVLKRFLLDHRPKTHRTLRALYILSPHRGLHDELVPFLFARGLSRLARNWRELLLLHKDVPSSDASLPFLRFLAGYSRRDANILSRHLSAKSELAVAEKEVGQKAADWKLTQTKQKSLQPTFGAPADPETNPIQLPWRAWADSLSLRPIRLEKRNIRRMVRRINEALQLRGGFSDLKRAVQRFSTVEDWDSLADLIDSDILPNISNDVDACVFNQRSDILTTLKRSRTIITVRLAVSLDLSDAISNDLVLLCLRVGARVGMLSVLDTMNLRGTQLSSTASNTISSHILRHVSPDGGECPVDLDFYAALCSKIMSMRFPIATDALKTILFRLGWAGRFDDVEHLSLSFANRFYEPKHSENGALVVHKLDVPAVSHDIERHDEFQSLPQDLSPSHPLHPLRLVFSGRIQQSILYCGFFQLPIHQPKGTTNGRAFASGVRLLAQLRDLGVPVTPKEVVWCVVSRLADIYAKPPKEGNLTLKEAKIACDEGWGYQIIPELPRFREGVEQAQAETRKTLDARLKSRQAAAANNIQEATIRKTIRRATQETNRGATHLSVRHVTARGPSLQLAKEVADWELKTLSKRPNNLDMKITDLVKKLYGVVYHL
ncbi:hypothetical protein B0T26DRAFT_131609 [Lasiosphaeria miniovina]|uniref:Pentatricopeptide repeat domain-containing protein n=1 Tax=Lasiosphaeria miniovina TaxID=1954250 RepID=A0AA40E703_9PEZI|nr:uncharacterized protein B0T26DRAFT_131609 [Lasiosphaeria miniovina]KAK0727357.1 hypothetical protein B0T26DRAFT_131609 [Lasiosphaeria miniovina]